jgi:hypothetical protein
MRGISRLMPATIQITGTMKGHVEGEDQGGDRQRRPAVAGRTLDRQL